MFGSSGPNKFKFSPIQIDANLLSQHYAINTFIKAGTNFFEPIDPRKYPSGRPPDIIVPWKISSEPKN